MSNLLCAAALCLLSTQAVAPIKPLRFWIWPSTIAQADLEKAIDQIRASGIQVVDDPATQPWTHILVWNSDDWILLPAGAKHGEQLGWTLKAPVLARHVPPGARVWINLPPSQELGGKIELQDESRGVKGVADFTTADYLLVSTLTPDGPAWAWVRKSAYERGAHKLTGPAGIDLCTRTARYPVRSPWLPQPDLASLAGVAAKLTHAAECFATMTGGLNEQGSEKQ